MWSGFLTRFEEPSGWERSFQQGGIQGCAKKNTIFFRFGYIEPEKIGIFQYSQTPNMVFRFGDFLEDLNFFTCYTLWGSLVNLNQYKGIWGGSYFCELAAENLQHR